MGVALTVVMEIRKVDPEFLPIFERSNFLVWISLEKNICIFKLKSTSCCVHVVPLCIHSAILLFVLYPSIHPPFHLLF